MSGRGWSWPARSWSGRVAASAGDVRWASVRKALEQARTLDAQGKGDEADAIRKALRDLYAEDPSAGAVLKGN